MASKVEIVQCLDKLKSAYPNYQPDVKLTLDLWKEIFADLPGDTLKAAILACITQDRAFAPSGGEIRAAAMKLHAEAAGIPDAYQAYEEVIRMPADMIYRNVTQEKNELGHTIIDEHTLKFTHPLVESVARMLGWPKSFPTDMPGVDRGQFIKAYDAELSRVMNDAGRLPILNDYIESRREILAGGSPLLTNAVKQLTKGK